MFVIPKCDRIAKRSEKKKQTVRSRRTEAPLSKNGCDENYKLFGEFVPGRHKSYWLNRINRAEKHGCFPMRIVDTGVDHCYLKKKKKKTVSASNKMRKYRWNCCRGGSNFKTQIRFTWKMKASIHFGVQSVAFPTFCLLLFPNTCHLYIVQFQQSAWHFLHFLHNYIINFEFDRLFRANSSNFLFYNCWQL